LLFIHSYREDVTTDHTESHIPDSTNEEDILAVRRKNKNYVPEKFKYFWPKESPFSQHFKCNIAIEGKDYSCTEQWIMKQKALCFGAFGLANRIMRMEEPGAMKRVGRQIWNFD